MDNKVDLMFDNKKEAKDYLLKRYPDRVVKTYDHEDWFECGVIQSTADGKPWTNITWYMNSKEDFTLLEIYNDKELLNGQRVW